MAKTPPRTPDAQMELIEHLAELRTRIFRALLYLGAGMILTYYFFPQIYELFAFPVQPILDKYGSTMLFTNIADPFLLRMQVCLISGITVAFPFITLELWGFIEPALTAEERKPLVFLTPFSVLLFLAGVAISYASLPTAYQWMSSYVDDVPGGTLFQDPKVYILLTAKILLAFGLSFELPMILLFLAKIGIITAEVMIKYWRIATVVIFFASGVLTPSNDPLTMLMMAVPMAGLYLLSIGLVRAFEPKEGKSGPSIATMLGVSLAPIAIMGAALFWLYEAKAFVPRKKVPHSIGEVTRQVEANQKATQTSITEVQTKFADVLKRLDALEKENAELKAKLSASQPTKENPVASPSPTATPAP